MRNRVYITSIKDKEDIGVSSLTNDAVRDWTVAHQNVRTFVPSLDGLFLNGKKYHSVNKNDNSVKNDDSARSVMKLVIIRDVDNDDIYNTNYISLVQQKLKKDFDIESLMLSVESDASVNGRIISVVMSVGESVQMFVNKNFGFVFDEKNPDCAVVDRNYIIHAIGVPQNGQPAKILIKHTSDTEDDAALYVIYVYIRYSYNILIKDIEQLKQTYPFLKVEYIGNSVLGNSIPCIKIGTGNKEVFYNASFHANEWITTIVLMKFVEDYSYAYANDGKIYN